MKRNGTNEKKRLKENEKETAQVFTERSAMQQDLCQLHTTNAATTRCAFLVLLEACARMEHIYASND